MSPPFSVMVTGGGSFERRQHLRMVATITFEVRNARGFALLPARDFSAGGAYFDRSIPMPVGSRLEVRFSLPGDGRAIRCEAEVANVPGCGLYGMGIRFVNLAPGDLSRIEAFSATLAE